jgi:hypothetical protein
MREKSMLAQIVKVHTHENGVRTVECLLVNQLYPNGQITISQDFAAGSNKQDIISALDTMAALIDDIYAT